MFSLFSRVDDDLSSDDDTPALKRLKQLKRTNYPDMATNGKSYLNWITYKVIILVVKFTMNP